ncbi:MAG: hypothetical protein M1818_005029 [Claussenomyces sp. TS43310]|nr:MAG: hypothetical protein M1818_005029 [Claussenomyces sp. TS43310]
MSSSQAAALEALLEYEKAHYADNRSPALLAGTIIVIVVMILAFVLRVFAQRMAGRANTPDMWLLLIGMIFALGIDGATIAAIRAGLGKHQLRLNDEDPHPPSHTIIIFKAGYVTDICCMLSVMFIKLAILVFYSRVFTLLKRGFRIILYIMAAYTIALGISSSITMVFLCSPPSFFWYRAYQLNMIKPPYTLEGKCLNNLVTVGLLCILDLVEDVILFVMPIFGLWGLQMAMRKKLGVFLAFSVGAFVIATNVIRIYYTFRITNSGDLGYSNGNAFIWSACQSSIGVVSASIPAMTPLYYLASRNLGSRLEKISSYRFGRSSDRSSGNAGSSSRKESNMAPTSNILLSVMRSSPGKERESETDSTKHFARETLDDVEHYGGSG